MNLIKYAPSAISAAVSLLLLYISITLFLQEQFGLAMMLVLLTAGFAIIFFSKRLYTARFYYPAVAGLALFTLFPVIYTSYIGYTNYGGSNLLTFEQVQNYYTSQDLIDKESEQAFELVADNDLYRLWLPKTALLSAPFGEADKGSKIELELASQPQNVLGVRDVVKNRELLKSLTLYRGDLELQVSSLKSVAKVLPAYRLIDDTGRLQKADGSILTPDQDVGFYKTESGEELKPGWKVWVGTRNFDRMFHSNGIREPIGKIFVWTVIFALVSVLATFAVGILLALVLQWRELKGKKVYRILLILPYAVPGFISILVFRGLFNQNFGEINFILSALFGIAPDWNTDPIMAKAMVLMVNIWLGYPYMMLLSMGFLQSIPEDHYKAAAIEGAGPIRQFFSITLPQILPPFVPMLISNFAFNFNNLVLIILLTKGGPDMMGTRVPAGDTDILASFTYRIAFTDSSQDFGLAGAISMLMFILVAVISYINLVAMRKMARGTK
ncbi:maltose ABC transporter permease MalF [Marinobacterium sedimentorum]|uniref:maltose ABC transporter permease MalF n=1 Tax=Marinobacterium sedimentorum TaxID=2927804 RepID=UPI0020C6BB30|nr:maltose ABC transporter permease MalF [Marinobacterium sedimentorum]MCP8690201.1 maltose ABC transporter permease MalF [Marinobacterium sedimentorum]